MRFWVDLALYVHLLQCQACDTHPARYKLELKRPPKILSVVLCLSTVSYVTNDSVQIVVDQQDHNRTGGGNEEPEEGTPGLLDLSACGQPEH